MKSKAKVKVPAKDKMAPAKAAIVADVKKKPMKKGKC